MSKVRVGGYWLSTALLVVAMGGGGVADLVGADEVVESFAALGYPQYLLPLLGVWKVLGCIAILTPRMALLKEWAYAGMVFDLTGAAYSHIAAQEPFGEAVAPLIVLALCIASYALRPADRRLVTASA